MAKEELQKVEPIDVGANYANKVDDLKTYPPQIANLGEMIRGQEDMGYRLQKMENNNVVTPYEIDFSNPQKTTSKGEMTNPFLNKIIENDKKIDPTKKTYIKRDSAYETLSDGSEVARFDKFYDWRDNEEVYAQAQTTGEKWSNGMKKFLGKTTVGTFGNVVGSIYGVVDAVAEGRIDAIYDNSFMDKLDDLSTKMDNKLPNYYTQAERDLSVKQKMFTSNFWADKVLGGASFTASVILSEATVAMLSAGTSLPTAMARVGANVARQTLKSRRLSKAEKALRKSIMDSGRDASKLNSNAILRKINMDATRVGTDIGHAVGKGLQHTRFTYMTSAYESGFEARMFRKDTEKNFDDSFMEVEGRLPTQEERMEFLSRLDDASDFVATSNMLIVGSSNLFGPVGYLLGRKTPKAKVGNWYTRNIFGSGVVLDKAGQAKALIPKKWQKLARIPAVQLSYGAVESAEEVGQGTVSSGAEEWVMSRFTDSNYDALKNILSVTIDNSKNYLGTDEAKEEALIGAIIGMVTGNAGSIRQNRNLGGKYASLDKYSQQIEKFSEEGFLGEAYGRNLLLFNRTGKAIEEYEKAIESGDRQAVRKASDDAILAQLSYAHSLGYLGEAVENVEKSMRSVPLSELMKAYGLKEGQEAEAEAQRERIIEQYINLSDRYTRNVEFVDKYIGDRLTKEELEAFKGKGTTTQQAEMLKDMLAYSMTIGETAYGEAQEAFQQVMEIFSDTYGKARANSLSIASILEMASKEDQAKMDTLLNELNDTTKKIEKLKKNRANAIKRGKVNEKTEIKRTNNLEAESAKEMELMERREELTKQLNVLQRLILAKVDPFIGQTEAHREDFTAEEYENLAEVIKDIETLLNDPNNGYADSKANALREALTNYNRALRGFQVNTELIKGLTTNKLQLTGKKGIMNRISKDPLNQVTRDFIEALLKGNDNFRNLAVIRTAHASAVNVKPERITINTENPSNVNIEPARFGLVEEMNYVLGKSAFVARENKEGKFTIDTLRKMTKEEQIKWLEGLTADESLTEQEKQLFAETILNKEGISLDDLIEQNRILTTDESTGESLAEGVNPEGMSSLSTQGTMTYSNSRGLSDRSAKVAQVYENAFISEESDGSFHIRNMTPEGFAGLSGATTATVITPEGTIVVPIDALNIYKNTTATGFKITVDGEVFTAEFVENGNIKISPEFTQKLIDGKHIDMYESNIFRTNKYVMIYKDGKPIKSDFNTQPGATYTPQQVYNLNKGDELHVVVPMDDVYNKQLLEEYKKKPNKKNKQHVRERMKIVLVDSRGNVVADLKSEVNSNDRTPEFDLIRENAVEVLLDKESKGKVSLKTTIPVEHIFLGMPNFNVKDGAIEMLDIDPNRVVDFGYVSRKKGGYTLHSKGQSQDVRLDLVEKLGKKRMPVVVVQYGNHLIAFPVSMKSNEGEFVKDFLKKLKSKKTNKGKLMAELNTKLQALNLKSKDFGDLFYATEDNQNIFEEGKLSENLVKALEAINERDTFFDFTKWTNKETTKDDVVEQAQIGVDLNTEFMSSPKIVLDFSKSNITPSKKAEEVKAKTPKTKVSKNKNVKKVIAKTQVNLDKYRELSKTNTALKNLYKRISGLSIRNTVKKSSVKDGETAVSILNFSFGKDRRVIVTDPFLNSIFELPKSKENDTLLAKYFLDLKEISKKFKDKPDTKDVAMHTRAVEFSKAISKIATHIGTASETSKIDEVLNIKNSNEFKVFEETYKSMKKGIAKTLKELQKDVASGAVAQGSTQVAIITEAIFIGNTIDKFLSNNKC